jgi:hypothetical protein
MRSQGSARFATGAAVIAAAALLVTGCGAGSSASPQPKAKVGSSAPSSAPSGPNLHYPEQLKASSYFKKPCTSLTDSQIRHVIGSKPDSGKHVNVPNAGRGCGWFPTSSDAPTNSIQIGWAEKGHGGLEFLYSIRDEFQRFQPTSPVSGFPAVIAGRRDEASTGECVISVGVNDQRAFFSQFQAGALVMKDTDLCGKARQAAKYVIQNLKGGS